VLDPDSSLTPWVLTVVLVALLAGLAVRAQRRDRREYQRFKRYRSTVRRQAMYRRWLVQSLVTFGSISAALLVLAWQQIPLLLADVNKWDGVRDARAWYASLGAGSIALVVVLAVVVIVLPIVALFFARKQEELTAIGDIQAMIPRNSAEVRLGVLLSFNAGIVEELLFRLALPAVVFGAFGSGWIAIVLSVLVFGILHIYQGVAGVVGTTIIGALLMVLYIATGSIVVPILVHVLIDIRSFVLIPVIVLGVGRRQPATA
jgi:membrane protease YdiL (CAAX protease family)